MTANLDILTDRKDNVLLIPQRSVFGDNDGRLVKVYLGADLPPEDRSVVIGLRGSDGKGEQCQYEECLCHSLPVAVGCSHVWIR